MNKNKFCFIICTNQEIYERECQHYIERLDVPDGYEVEVKFIKNAHSMTSGYNKGMEESDSKYKIYMHQDVFIVNRKILYSILKLFENDKIGMIGIVGNKTIHESFVMWLGQCVGMLYSNSIYFANSYLFGEIQKEYEEVEAIDGLMMITQYDLPWREDIFSGWDFYDMSQSTEFRKTGLKVIVPRTEKPWCIHDDGLLDLKNYFDEREKYMEEYVKGGEQKC